MRTRHLKWVPVVQAARCNGCNRCVAACENRAFELRDGLAVLVWRNACRSDGECVAVCPVEALRMEWVEWEGDRSRGKWTYGGRVWPGRVRGG